MILRLVFRLILYTNVMFLALVFIRVMRKLQIESQTRINGSPFILKILSYIFFKFMQITGMAKIQGFWNITMLGAHIC